MSTFFAGNYTISREITRAPIEFRMTESYPHVNIDRLKADMADYVARKSAAKLSKAATFGKNPDFYRNFLNDGQDKRLSANIFVGLCKALEKDPLEYVEGFEAKLGIPNEAVLSATFDLLLNSIGINPLEDGRARKLAAQFPDALRDMINLQGRTREAVDSIHVEASHADDEAGLSN